MRRSKAHLPEVLAPVRREPAHDEERVAGGVAGLLMRHRPLIRARALGPVIASYLVAALPSLALAGGAILAIETVARLHAIEETDRVIHLLGLSLPATAPVTWGVAAVLTVGGLLVARLTWRRVAQAWDQAATIARDRGYLT